MTNSQKIFEALKKLPFVAEKERWLLTLDKNEGSLFYAPSQIPKGSELHQVTDEYAMYLDENNKPTGLMIEYFNVNFIKHHDIAAQMSKTVFESSNSNQEEQTIVVDPKEKTNKSAFLLKAFLEKPLIQDALTKPVF